MKKCYYAGALALFAASGLTGCVDDSYDLADVDTTTRINVNDLVIPVNVAPIVLDQVIDLDSENIGTVRYGDKEFYAFHQSGDFHSDGPIHIPEVKVTAPEIKGNSTSIEQIIGDQKGPRKASPFEGACFSYEIMHPIGDDFEYSADDIDHSIVAVNSVRTSPFQFRVNLSISGTDLVKNVTLRDMQREMYGYSLGASGTSLENNTTMRTLAIQDKLLRQNVTLKKFAWIPSLAASYNMNWNAMSSGNAFRNQQFNPYSTVSLALQVPVFNGLGRLNAVKQAEIQYKELQLNRENVESSLRMQVRLALDNIDKEVRQIASSEEGVRQAAKANEIMQKSFEIGAASYLNLRDAELANTSAQLAYLQAIYNYLVSTSELDTLLGREDALGISRYNTAK